MKLKQKLTKKLMEGKCFIYFVIQHFFKDDCLYRASALAFTTLLAIVPVMAVSFSILSTFPLFQSLAKPAQDFIFANFVPSTGKMVQDYLMNFANQASKLSTIGMVFLFIISLLMMYTIESAMNKIWRVHTSRHRLLTFLLYWGVVFLTPFLLGISLVVSSYILSIPFLAKHDIPALVSYLPFLFSLTGFTFLYVVVPNCPTRVLHGFYGGLIAATLFESAKHAFGYYLSHYDMYQLLYGAFATVPIFFIWVYWVWLITLLGAEISYAFSVHHQRRLGLPLDGFSHALLYLYELRLAEKESKELTLDELINTSTCAYKIKVNDLLNVLIKKNLIKKTYAEHYVLKQDLKQLTLYELAKLLPYRLPYLTELAQHEHPLNQRWHTLIQAVDTHRQQMLTIPLDHFFQEEPQQNKP